MRNDENSSSESEVDDREDSDKNDDIEILFASDINLGYEQTIKRDQKDDSFRTFEEILKYARDYDVDAILLAGNLFYESNPPLNVITRCISLLRRYCLNQKCVKIDCITDPEWIFNHCPHKIVNFKDSNLNIGIPIFSISGHRDRSIFGPTGPLDLLAATGLINYFGKWTNNNGISIPPLLLRKGITTLGLYGLNYMNEEKLSKLLKRDKFELLRDESITNICNVLVLHENRARRNRAENMFVSERLLPDFLNLVIWGHEPECQIEVKSVPNKSFRISQPGSTIATLLTKGEALRKRVAILKIFKNNYEMKYLKLKTVRPFVFHRLNLNERNSELSNLQQRIKFESNLKKRKEIIETFIDNYIKNNLLQEVKKQETGHPDQPKKPLLRLEILHNRDEDSIDLFRLFKKYEDKIANPEDMITFLNYSLVAYNFENNDDNDDYDESAIMFKNEAQTWKRTVDDEMTRYFDRNEIRKKFRVLALKDLNKAMIQFKNNDNKAFDRLVKNKTQTAVNHLLNDDVELEDVLETIQDYQSESSDD